MLFQILSYSQIPKIIKTPTLTLILSLRERKLPSPSRGGIGWGWGHFRIKEMPMGMGFSKIKSSSVLLSFIIFLCAFALFASGMLLSPTTASAATGMWVTETVDGPGIVGWDSSVAVDSKGWVHISYYDASNGDLRHAVNAYGTWVIETVDSAGDVGWYSSMAFDSAGKPHIGYFDVTNGDLKHAYINASGVWVSEVVDSEGVIRGEHLSLAIDHSDNVHISYYDSDR